MRSLFLAVALQLAFLAIQPMYAADDALYAPEFSKLADFVPDAKAWTAQKDGSTVGESPEYYSLPETARGTFNDDHWTYHTIYPVALWRYALAGKPEWTDYTVDCTLTVEKPAPLKGFRGGETFYNYQWGREAYGSDAAIVVRYKGPDDNYMVRCSTGFGHVELWKTHGGVVQVKPFAFAAGKAYRVSVTAAGPWIIVAVDGKELIRYADPIEPILSGRAGVAVRESRTAFSGFTVRPAVAPKEAVPAHVAKFAVREWVGKPYIFDGDEPIAWFFRNPSEGIQLREMKLAPGLMPMVMPNLGIASYALDGTKGEYAVTKDGATLAFTSKQKAKEDAFECTGDWTLVYQAGQGYIWDKTVKMTANKDKAETDIQIDDPFFYQMVAPQTTKLAKCRTEPNYCIFERADKLIAFPSSHHLWKDGLGDEGKAIIKAGGFGVPTIDGWGVAMQMDKDNPTLFTAAFCHWGLDYHIRMVGALPKKGETFTGRMRFMLWDRARVKDALAKGVLPEPAAGSSNPELFNNVEPVNAFQDISHGLTGESVRLWTGAYVIDRTVGHGDSLSMRIDPAAIKVRKDVATGDDRPNVWQGSSYWTGPYLAQKYRVGMWVKAENFKGTVAILLNGIAAMKPADPKEYRAALPIDGKCDWTHVTFETTVPRNAFSWVLRIDPEGTGVIWVDDVEISPLP